MDRDNAIYNFKENIIFRDVENHVVYLFFYIY